VPDAEVVPDATKREEAQRRWRKGRLVVIAASKFQQAGVDGAARREAEVAAVAKTGEEARRRWRKGRLLVTAAGRFKMAGEDGAARRAMEDEQARAKAVEEALSSVKIGQIQTDPGAEVKIGQSAEARRRWRKGRLVVVAARKMQQAGANSRLP